LQLDTATPSKRQFKLLKRIGVGGFGEVYLAELQTNSGFAKTVALKLLRSDIAGGEEMATRIRDEARLLGMMRHRAIVQADDLITLAGRPTVVMEFIPGVNLNWLLNPNRFRDEIPPTCALEIIRHVADALDVAYSRPSSITGRPLEVLHRDIKPANVRITPDGEVKVLDFGIARSDHMDRESHTQDYNLGSLRYMAPEMLLEGRASPASDIYSLGVLAFETVARIRFGLAGDAVEDHQVKVNKKLQEADLRGLGEHAEAARQLVASMLHFDYDERPTAREVMRRCQELEKQAQGPAMWEWAPDAIPLVKIPEQDEENGELTGRTLYEEPSGRLPEGVTAQEAVGSIAAETTGADATVALEQEPEPPKATGGGWRLVVLLGLAIAAAALLVLRTPAPSESRPAAQPAHRPPPAKVEAIAPVPADAEIVAAEGEVADGEAADGEPEVPGAEKADAEPSSEPAKTKAPAAEPATVKPAPKPAKKSTPPPAAAAPVRVRLASMPFGIAVFVDGKSVGKTPVATQLAPGTHKLLFVDGEDSIRKTVTVRAGEENKFVYRRAEGAVR